MLKFIPILNKKPWKTTATKIAIQSIIFMPKKKVKKICWSNKLGSIENKNIRILNKKQPYLQVLKDNKWEFRIKKNELINILKNRYIYLEEHYNKVKDELTEEELKILDEYKKDYSYIFNLFAENEKKLELLIITNK